VAKQLIAGNWKMYMKKESAIELIRGVGETAKGQDAAEVAACPPSVYLADVIRAAEGTTIKIGAQNVHWEEEGAFTGELSPQMLLDIGCDYSVIGHSERRQYFGETNETVNKKTKACLAAGLAPIFCLGEVLEQRESGQMEDVVSTQLREGLAGVTPDQLNGFVVAYEPVWAIGTGKTATPEQAEEVHALLWSILEEEFGVTEQHGLRILYGGSVKPANAKEILGQPHVDGALVGGASLKPDAFSDIILAAQRR
jgi:triosephosphate isomerase